MTKRSCVTFNALESTWRAMNSTLTNRGVKHGPHTARHDACASLSCLCGHARTKSNSKTASPLHTVTCVHQLQCTFSIGNTAGAGQHRLIRSTPSRTADVAVAQNDLPLSFATPDRAWPCRAPCFAFDDFPSIVGDRDDQTCCADETTTRDGRPLA